MSAQNTDQNMDELSILIIYRQLTPEKKAEVNRLLDSLLDHYSAAAFSAAKTKDLDLGSTFDSL